MHPLFLIYLTIVFAGAIFIGVAGFVWPVGGKKVATPIPEPIRLISWLTMYPNCVICGKEWAHLPGKTDIQWCSNNHDTIWFYQEDNGVCSFDREVNDLYGTDYLVSWNCQCSDQECLGQNIIYQYDDKDHKHIVKCVEPVDLFMLPLNISRERLHDFIGQP